VLRAALGQGRVENRADYLPVLFDQCECTCTLRKQSVHFIRGGFRLPDYLLLNKSRPGRVAISSRAGEGSVDPVWQIDIYRTYIHRF
jgi:hypothetical protein